MSCRHGHPDSIDDPCWDCIAESQGCHTQAEREQFARQVEFWASHDHIPRDYCQAHLLPLLCRVCASER